MHGFVVRHPRLAQRPEFANQFESSHLVALAATLEVIGEHGHRLFAESVVTSRAALVRDDPDWSAMRSAAVACLATFGIDATALRVNDIDDESSP